VPWPRKVYSDERWASGMMAAQDRMMFRDRKDAARAWPSSSLYSGTERRSCWPAARRGRDRLEIARRLGAPLDIILVRKSACPGSQGARRLADGGTRKSSSTSTCRRRWT
jgi:predicted phosphoribosyltransferase